MNGARFLILVDSEDANLHSRWAQKALSTIDYFCQTEHVADVLVVEGAHEVIPALERACDGELPEEAFVAGANHDGRVLDCACTLSDCGVRPLVVENCCWSGWRGRHLVNVENACAKLGNEQVVGIHRMPAGLQR